MAEVILSPQPVQGSTSPMENFGENPPPPVSEQIETKVTPGVALISNAEVPYTIEEPLDPDLLVSETGILVVHGFYGIQSAYGGIRNHFAQQGHRAITYGRADQSWASFFHPSQAAKPHRLISQAPLGVMRTIHQEHGIDSVHTVGHSYGGAIALEIALFKQPEQQKSVTLLASAGTDGHTLMSLAHKLPDEAWHDIIPSMPDLARACGIQGLWEAIRYAKNPIRLLFETLDVTHRDIRPHIQAVVDSGIPVAAVPFKKDRFFKAEEVKAHIGNVVTLYSEFPDPDAEHSAPMTQPAEVAQFTGKTIGKMTGRLSSVA